MDNVKKIMNSKYGQIGIRGLISIILGISIFLAVYYGMSRDYKSLCDGFAISGSCLLAIGAFSLINNFGFFDFASYGFASTISALRKDIVKPYKDLIEYKCKKEEKVEFLCLYFDFYFIFL